jgi:endoglucanase
VAFGQPTHRAGLWGDRAQQERVVAIWRAIAGRYRGAPSVAGYNPVNEPGDVDGRRLVPFYDELASAIREVDPEHILFLEGNRHAPDFDLFGDPLPNAVYTLHDYALPGYPDGGPYPGVSRGEHVDGAALERKFLERSRYMRETGTPIWVGEFGPVYPPSSERHADRLAVLGDQLDIYDRNGASWSMVPAGPSGPTRTSDCRVS